LVDLNSTFLLPQLFFFCIVLFSPLPPFLFLNPHPPCKPKLFLPNFRLFTNPRFFLFLPPPVFSFVFLLFFFSPTFSPLLARTASRAIARLHPGLSSPQSPFSCVPLYNETLTIQLRCRVSSFQTGARVPHITLSCFPKQSGHNFRPFLALRFTVLSTPHAAVREPFTRFKTTWEEWCVPERLSMTCLPL